MVVAAIGDHPDDDGGLCLTNIHLPVFTPMTGQPGNVRQLPGQPHCTVSPVMRGFE
ncbi:hypothetical protein ACFWA5_50250 [Streptomyces mirabilis]|uniref:hypothetical protein n=1 Tax=Streptomyces mirabilis TaxID=68239 RepID=UPI00365549BB